ncbi:palmitoyltransferase PFA5 [Ophiocordyceps camponoti-floridani]|uniref:Palmitoyltransferase n=1 Tax=Ophiocordyceps camponoti-floridani TaxID=2030778 RepID=A0A8H4Q865_9HYPO|nr:palmitoyltransferase PFA5 [Ophiocordyceps camponoti-floridani]
MRPSDSNRTATRWSIRLMPLFIAAVLGIATYSVVYRLCVRFLYRKLGKSGLTATFLVLYWVFFLLAGASYFRTFAAAQFNSGLVPLLYERDAFIRPSSDEQSSAMCAGKGFVGAFAKRPSKGRGRDPERSPWVPPDQDPDSPGLEAFYSKDVFLCEPDGRPKWCSDCRQWKPDRAHHSSELDRCVRKMDHLCPWVGGMVSETSFNFFFQFTFYTFCYCVICLSACAYALHQEKLRGPKVDGWFIAVVAIASIFTFFTLAMTLTSARLILTNYTSIDILRKSQVIFLAVRIPRNSPSTEAFTTVSYPLERPPPSMSDTSHARSSMDRDPSRDRRATRKFAILRLEPNDNPWDLGYWGNWKSVMGSNVFEWLLPIRHSPCCNHESMESDYRLGPLLAASKKRYGVPELDGDVDGVVEMHDTAMLAP